ncbi:hypothetical protein SAMN04488029_3261 [Reichenbachiella faecimaris]|uniref:Uncharacterized protein n=1 Tax=Reichenbachiella faecimaris TaxID=692418 RepID=A0A1W2GKF4_REIFA|nr:hypothetical protein [Reichenbachiella faecimaris]SMD37145.1 hypothetical protein SAMN04488029_3261 [Reichenbachiella faecimaris]
MATDQLNIVFYIFIGIFSITAILTFLGITGVIKSIQPKHLNALFAGLILEVVSAVIFTYKQIDFSCQTENVVDRLGSQVANWPDGTDLDQKIVTLQAALVQGKVKAEEVAQLEGERDQLKGNLATCQESQSNTNTELTTLDKVFYSNVIKLRIISEKFRGRTINLIWDQANKAEVYQILGQIFLDLGYVGPNDELSHDFIIAKYIKFANESGWEYLLKKNEAGDYNQVLLDEYATTIFLRKYLNQKYPLKN